MAAVYPVPELAPTLDELRRIMKSLLEEGDYEHFSDLLQDLNQTELPEIQAQFEERVKGKTNWSTENFLTTILSVRHPIPFSTSMTALLEEDEMKRDKLSRAASLLVAVAMIYKKKNVTKKVQTGLVKERYDPHGETSNVLAATRIPGKDMDEIVRKDSKHAAVISNGGTFCVQILDGEGQTLPGGVIRKQLQNIVERSSTDVDTNDILTFTGLPRSHWSNFRSQLQRNPSTAEYIEKLESSIVVLTLEEKSTPESLSDTMKDICQGQRGSRYYDKLVGLIVYDDGQAGLLIDHSCTDGFKATVFTEILFQLAKEVTLKEVIDHDIPVPEYLDLSAKDLIANIPVIKGNHDVITFDVQIPRDALSVLKDARMRDACLHLSLQLALSTMEPTSSFLIAEPTYMGNFQFGSTDPTYPVSTESRELIATLNTNQPFSVLLDLCMSAVKRHNSLIKSTKVGKAFGPHLGIIRSMLQTKVPEHPILKYLTRLRVPEVVMTGADEEWRGIRSGVGNLYSSDQLVINFLVKHSCVHFTAGARGTFMRLLPDFSKVFTKSLEEMATLFLPLATRKVMLTDVVVQHASAPTADVINKPGTWALALHGGAGGKITTLNGGAGGSLDRDDKVKNLVEFALSSALQLGADMLKAGRASVDVVQEVTAALENCFLFNAGKGAVYNKEGKHELEAAIVDGDRGMYGAMGCLSNVKNPIYGARLVMEKTRHCIVTGDAAESLCAKEGIKPVSSGYFYTDHRKHENQAMDELHPQTVGVVALDIKGKLAASSSTGGLCGKMKGRIGDTAINGAGLIATADCAVSCTGLGEVFLRKCVASSVVGLVTAGQKSLHEACKETVASSLSNGEGGLIAVDKSGNVICEYSSEAMLVGMADSKGTFQAHVLVKPTNESNKICNESQTSGTQCLITEGHTVYPHPSPNTPGTIFVEQDTAQPSSELLTDETSFINLMFAGKIAAQRLQTQLKVQRCALVLENVQSQKPKLQVIPLRGLTREWASVKAEEFDFSHTYNGFVTTKDGPRASDEDLTRVQHKITNKTASNWDYSFYGNSANDNNLFARLIRGEEQQWRIWENSEHVAFLTPFPNTPGYSVVVPRRHLSSDVLNLLDDDFKRLFLAVQEVAVLLKKSFGASGVAIVCEGMEIDYAHVKVIPLCGTGSEALVKETGHHKAYKGYISSQPGPALKEDEVEQLQQLLAKISPPKSFHDPVLHSTRTMANEWYRGLFQVQNTLFHETVNYFSGKMGYKYALTPVTTDCISSPMGLGSDSDPVQIRLFDRDVYLADSMQFTLEYFLRMEDNLPGTYYISSSFRGEDPDATHLNQFYHVECELLGDMHDAIKGAEGYLQHITRAMLKEHRTFITATAGKTDHVEELIRNLAHGLPRLTLKESIDEVDSALVEDVVEGDPKLGKKLTRAAERQLIGNHGNALWVTEMDHLGVPFYQAYTDDSRPGFARNADLLVGMGETLGLGERHITADQVMEALDQHAIELDAYSWYIDMRRQRPLLTSGWGMGSERYLCWLLGHDDVRDIQILPRLKGFSFLP